MSRQGFQRSQFYGNTPQIEDEAGSYAGLLQEDEADSYADLLQEDEAGSYADLLQILNQDDLNVTASGCNHSIQLSFVTIPGSDADRPWSCKSCELEQVRRDRDVANAVVMRCNRREEELRVQAKKQLDEKEIEPLIVETGVAEDKDEDGGVALPPASPEPGASQHTRGNTLNPIANTSPAINRDATPQPSRLHWSFRKSRGLLSILAASGWDGVTPLGPYANGIVSCKKMEEDLRRPRKGMADPNHHRPLLESDEEYRVRVIYRRARDFYSADTRTIWPDVPETKGASIQELATAIHKRLLNRQNPQPGHTGRRWAAVPSFKGTFNEMQRRGMGLQEAARYMMEVSQANRTNAAPPNPNGTDGNTGPPPSDSPIAGPSRPRGVPPPPDSPIAGPSRRNGKERATNPQIAEGSQSLQEEGYEMKLERAREIMANSGMDMSEADLRRQVDILVCHEIQANQPEVEEQGQIATEEEGGGEETIDMFEHLLRKRAERRAAGIR